VYASPPGAVAVAVLVGVLDIVAVLVGVLDIVAVAAGLR
jgi:hypothetical protein